MKRATWRLLPGDAPLLDPAATTRVAVHAPSRPRWWARVRLSPSSTVYLALMAYLVAVRLTLSLFPAIFRSPAQAGRARTWKSPATVSREGEG